MSFVCKDCDSKKYVSQYALNRHRKEVHGQFDLRIQTYPFDTFKHKCLESCVVSFSTTRELRQHLAREHAIYTQQAIFEFEDVDEFLSWKADSLLEKHYKDCGTNLNGNLEVTYYSCLGTDQNSPEIIETETEEGREEYIINSKGSNSNVSCTSEMIVVKNLKTNIVAVTYFKTHYGHKNNIEHIKTPLNFSAKKKIALTTSIPERLVVTPDIPTTRKRYKKPYIRRINPKQKRNRLLKNVHEVIIKPQESKLENNDNEVSSESMRSDSFEDTLGNQKCDNRRGLKKEIFYLIQELSENNFEEYDENTLTIVRDTLSECCYFLNSYESSEDPLALNRTPQDNPSESSSSPPKLVWFNK